jgi:hypothetical protein
MDATHHIKRLQIALRVPDQKTADDLHQTVSAFCRTDLDELLLGAFDMVPPDRWLRIDRLEIGLPAFRNVEAFRSEMGQRIREALRDQLDDHVASAAVSTALVGELSQHAPKSFDTSCQAADAFIHFLQHGAAPWHATRAAYDEIITRVIALLSADPVLTSQLSALLLGPGPVLERFIRQTATPDRHRIVSSLTGMDHRQVAEAEGVLGICVDILTRGSRSHLRTDLVVIRTAVRNLLRYRSLDSAVIGSMLGEVMKELSAADAHQHPDIMVDLAMAGMELETALPERWRTAVRDSVARYAIPSHEYRERAEGIGPPLSDRPTAPRPVERHAPAIKDRGKKVHPQQNAPTASGKRWRTSDRRFSGGQVEKPQPKDSVYFEEASGYLGEVDGGDSGSTAPHNDSEASDRSGTAAGRLTGSIADRSESATAVSWLTPYEADAFHLHNAGLVLVALFFGRAFKDLGYLENGREFATDETRVRAVHFSQFLVTAEPHPAECDLVLNKILCGMDVADPLVRFLDLTEKEREAATDVLTSAVKHWTVLKQTSVPVFQQTFLQHDGILTRESGHWLLRIERLSADVLIDTLPWTISIIKHPWMQQAIMVEW